MNWNNLKLNKCPKCNKDLVRGIGRKLAHVPSKPIPVTPEQLDCTQTTANALPTEIIITHSCGFSVRESRMAEIMVNTMGRKKEEHYRPSDEERE